jgi:hypothetical protein
MRTPFLPSDSVGALEQACQDVEGTVSRLAKLVLHASALADRMDAVELTDPPLDHGRSEHVRVLRQAAEAGRRAIAEAGLAASTGGRVGSAVPGVGSQRRR